MMNNNPGKLRLFVALDLSAEIERIISRLVRVLAGRLEGVSWTPSANTHLTLKFLGEVETEQIPHIQSCLDQVSERQLPLAVSLAGLGSFPGKRNPRVIWTGVGEGRMRLIELAEDLDRALAGLDIPRENRSYTPHLTLGRVKNPRAFSTTVWQREIEARKLDSLGSFKSDMIVLFQSILAPKGAIHRVVSRHQANNLNLKK